LIGFASWNMCPVAKFSPFTFSSMYMCSSSVGGRCTGHARLRHARVRSTTSELSRAAGHTRRHAPCCVCREQVGGRDRGTGTCMCSNCRLHRQILIRCNALVIEVNRLSTVRRCCKDLELGCAVRGRDRRSRSCRSIRWTRRRVLAVDARRHVARHVSVLPA
jgi:hypothetical protein